MNKNSCFFLNVIEFIFFYLLRFHENSALNFTKWPALEIVSLVFWSLVYVTIDIVVRSGWNSFNTFDWLENCVWKSYENNVVKRFKLILYLELRWSMELVWLLLHYKKKKKEWINYIMKKKRLLQNKYTAKKLGVYIDDSVAILEL